LEHYGKLADLVVLSSDPLDDIHNTRSVKAVYQAGELVYSDSSQD